MLLHLTIVWFHVGRTAWIMDFTAMLWQPDERIVVYRALPAPMRERRLNRYVKHLLSEIDTNIGPASFIPFSARADKQVRPIVHIPERPPSRDQLATQHQDLGLGAQIQPTANPRTGPVSPPPCQTSGIQGNSRSIPLPRAWTSWRAARQPG
ncbi:uncharacterized protein K452DRAFT_68803 [Aplosporella prunicola CBS 121167]|uniref:Uncharacterized protein n=1 Tax=Aplosporella prunicola CBS 121167 TaxID=1176127 RepID=A0A6A6BRC7_9PEZI|nr:uncharacterized protein K452DRAFT_68803 [Aplosporella prunicola CBS 121167]KAF2146646.1 hypothetical protein K452DRAFT_68803 [Aplosporella prunicola CBS 121167]